MKTMIRLVTLLLFVFGFLSSTIGQWKKVGSMKMTKEEFYNNILAPQYGLQPLHKLSALGDRKRSVMDVGNVWARIANHATLGYDRWGLCWEFPAKSGFTYRWTMGPLVGALKKNPTDGTKEPLVAVATRGAFRYSEEEYQPLGGFDSGIYDEVKNIGIPFSDKPESWPTTWPVLNQLPAHARKVTYNQPLVGSTGFPGVLNGEVVATREAYFAVTDNDPEKGNNPRPLDVRVDLWALQWDNFVNRNFIIFRMLVTNIGPDTLEDAYIGIHDDPDTPEQGAAEWTDDYAAFIREGTDVPDYTATEDTLLWNFTYLWDGDDRVEGLIASNVGWVGLKFMETPLDATTGKPKGITTFQVFEYSAVPRTEATEYAQLKAGIMPPPNVAPHPGDYTQTPNSYGPDITYVVASGPFQLAPGQSLPFTFASVHAANRAELLNNAMLCQLLYNKNYQSPLSPPESYLRAIAGDRKVTLYWDDRSEKGVYYRTTAGPDGEPRDSVLFINDPVTGTNAFEGYQIFKSTDRGRTWGTQTITDLKGGLQYYVPLAQFDIQNGVTGESASRRYFPLGSDAGLKHFFVDRNVNNGYEYWYALVAYDRDDGPIPPLENPVGRNPDNSPFDHVVRVVPQRPASGATLGSIDADGIKHTAGLTSVKPELDIFNPAQVTGKTYTVNFTEVAATGEIFFTVKDPDNVIALSITKRDTVQNWPVYSAATDNAPIFDGMRVQIGDLYPGMVDFQQTVGSGLTVRDIFSYYDFTGASPGDRNSLASDYEFRFVSTPQTYPDFTRATTTTPFGILANFEVWNLTKNQRVTCEIGGSTGLGGNNDRVWDAAERIYIVDRPHSGDSLRSGNPYAYRVRFRAGSTYATGDRFSFVTEKILTKEDVFEFSTVKQAVAAMRESDLENITTVPNPFVVSSYFETLSFGVSKELQFHHLPPKCTIRIYNMAGDYVQTIIHDDPNSSFARWNLQSYNGQEVAFGIYFFHVDAPGIGEHIGKFAVIK